MRILRRLEGELLLALPCKYPVNVPLVNVLEQLTAADDRMRVIGRELPSR